MTFTPAAPVLSHPRSRVAHAGLGRTAVGGFFLVMGGVHLGLVSADPGRAARIGWAAVITFHVLLLCFGWWVWAWCLPALALLVTLARRDLRSAQVPS